MTNTVGLVTTSRTAMSRDFDPAFSAPKPTVTTGISWLLQPAGDGQRGRPGVVRAVAEQDDRRDPRPGLALDRVEQRLPEGGLLALGRGSCRRRGRRGAPCRTGRTSPSAPRRGSCTTSRACASVFRSRSQRLWPLASSVIVMLVEASERKISDAGCFFFSWKTTDGRSAAITQSRMAASRRPRRDPPPGARRVPQPPRVRPERQPRHHDGERGHDEPVADRVETDAHRGTLLPVGPDAGRIRQPSPPAAAPTRGRSGWRARSRPSPRS